jgi:hypothetical protein
MVSSVLTAVQVACFLFLGLVKVFDAVFPITLESAAEVERCR